MPHPVSIRSAGGRIVQIVIKSCRIGFRFRVAIEEYGLAVGIYDVVFENVVRGVPLNLKFAFARPGRIVVK